MTIPSPARHRMAVTTAGLAYVAGYAAAVLALASLALPTATAALQMVVLAVSLALVAGVLRVAGNPPRRS